MLKQVGIIPARSPAPRKAPLPELARPARVISPARPLARRDVLLLKRSDSERDAEAYCASYAETLSDATTKLEGRFDIR